MVSDAERRRLFTAVERALGREPAHTLMELLPPVGWADVARRGDLVALSGSMAELGANVRTEMAELRVELKTDMADLRVEMADMRTELKTEMADLRGEVHADLRAQLPRMIAANLGAMIGLAALVLAAVRLG